jgi:Zn-dependent protease
MYIFFIGIFVGIFYWLDKVPWYRKIEKRIRNMTIVVGLLVLLSTWGINLNKKY